MNKILLDQEIIVKALYVLGEAYNNKPNDFITKEMLERLPELKDKEMNNPRLRYGARGIIENENGEIAVFNKQVKIFIYQLR